jgi:anti-sigma factor RsiW
MKPSMNDKDVRKYIEAFADGELDVEQNLTVLEHMAMNPDATRRVMHQQQLRQVVDRAMREMSPSPSDDLRARIEALADDARRDSLDEAAGQSKSQTTVLARFGRWLPTIAAALLLGVALWLFSQSQNLNGLLPDGGSAAVQLIYNSGLITDSSRSAFAVRHATCGKQIEQLQQADYFGQEIADLPKRVTSFLGQDNDTEMPVLNLAALGYKFAGAGQCAAPGAKAAHLVYRNEQGEALSLWVRSGAADELKIKPGKLYAAATDGKVNPVLVWRRGDHVFYLVGDTVEDVRQAAQKLAMK